jgi:membrane fusion protein, heavy metal efflux system
MNSPPHTPSPAPASEVRASSERPPPRWSHLRRRLGVLFVFLAGMGAGGGLLAGVMRPSVPHSAAAPSASAASLAHGDASARGPVAVSPELLARMNVRTAPPEARAIAPQVDVVGTATFDPQRLAAVGTRIAGRVVAVHKFEGDVVKRGDVLAEIESAELGQAQAAIGTARVRAQTAEANFAREQTMLESHATSERDVERAREAALVARAELVAADKRVQAMGGDTGGPIGVLRLRSPIHGKVVERRVAPGQTVDATFTAFRVADLRQLWAELAVFERDLSALRAGDAVDLATQADPTVTERGRIAHVGDVIDQESRTARVRVEVDNERGALRPGQAVVAHVHTAPKEAAMVVPADAVVTVDGKPIVFVARPDGAFDPRPVVLGARDNDRVEITSGLTRDESIAVSGVFALKSELFR